MLYWFLKIIAYVPFWLFCPIIVKGKKHLPKGKCIIVANHRSNFDPLILLNMVWREQHVLAKKEVFNNKFNNWFFRSMKAIPVNRGNIDISTVKECLGVLKNDKVLTIFPEGTRNKTDKDLLEIKNGAGVFATKTNAPIVPIWFKKKPRPFVFNTMYVGEPFYLTKEDAQNDGEIIKEHLLDLKNKYTSKK